MYLERREIYACMRGGGKPYDLENEWEPAVSSSGGGGVLRVGVNGAYAVASSEIFDQSGTFAWLYVRDLRRRRAALFHEAGFGWSGYEKLFDVVLCAHGRVGWIEATESDSRLRYEVRAGTGHRLALLDSGFDIQPGSLRASTGLLGWIDGGQHRKAAVECAHPVATVAAPRLTFDQAFGYRRARDEFRVNSEGFSSRGG